MTVPHDESLLPDEDRIKGIHIGEYVEKISSDTETFEKNFSNYLLEGLNSKKIEEHISSIKKEIVLSYKSG